MSIPPATAAGLYLDLMESVLTGTLMEDPPIVTDSYKQIVSNVLAQMFGVQQEPVASALGYSTQARDVGLDWPSHAFTMIGRKRLRNFRNCIEDVLRRSVPGDIVETGVWRGGASIMARAVLAAHGVTDRRIFLADSFAGLPPPDQAAFPADAGDRLHTYPELAVSRAQVAENFEKFHLLDDQVVFVEGWFRDTMPVFPVQRIAVLRLDGDMYESTIDPLRHLWDRVMPGGFVIVDDYHFIAACRQAVADFFTSRAMTVERQEIDGIGIYFRKPDA